MELIGLKEVVFAYSNGDDLLRGCGLEVSDGEVVAIAGPNGCGKSTLLRLAAGLATEKSGEIVLDGRRVKDWDRMERARRLAYVPQRSRVPEEWTVSEVAELGWYPYRTSSSGKVPLKRRLDEVKNQLKLDRVWNRKLVTLSGGEVQRASLARAFVQDTHNLILDEPAAHLDLSYQMALYRFLSELAASGRSILVATHDLNLSRLFGQRLVILGGNGNIRPFPPDREGQGRLLEEVFGLSFISKELTGVDCWFPNPQPYSVTSG